MLVDADVCGITTFQRRLDGIIPLRSYSRSGRASRCWHSTLSERTAPGLLACPRVIRPIVVYRLCQRACGSWSSVYLGNTPAPDPRPRLSGRRLPTIANNAAVDQQILVVAVRCQRLEHPFPRTRMPPPAEARVHRLPLAVSFRQIALGYVGAQHPQTSDYDRRLPAPVRPGSATLPGTSNAIRDHCASFNAYCFIPLTHFAPQHGCV